MKLVFAFAALLFALTSVAASGARYVAGDADHSAAAAASFQAGGADCHDQTGHESHGEGACCGQAAFCALFCGVVPPAGPDYALAAQFFSIDFAETADLFYGAQKQPEAPPPRIVIL